MSHQLLQKPWGGYISNGKSVMPVVILNLGGVICFLSLENGTNEMSTIEEMGNDTKPIFCFQTTEKIAPHNFP